MSTRRPRPQYARDYAERRSAQLIEIDLRADHGVDVPTAARATKRAPCSACGLCKRHLFDRAALDGGYDAVATGHNLDDEAAVLFGNTLRWNTEYLARQRPVLPARDGFPRKIKPLVRLGEREMAAYCVIQGIDYIVEECPMAAGNKHIGYKEALNAIESDVAGLEARLLPRVPGPGRRPLRTPTASPTRTAAAPANGVARPPPTRSARSATCSSAPRAPSP